MKNNTKQKLTISISYLVTLYFIITVSALTTFSSQANDGEINAETSAVINKVLQAYGGDKLVNAKAIKLIDHNKGPWKGESENPGIPEIWRINEELVIDFVNQRKSWLSYRVPRTTKDLEKWIFDGKRTVNYDIFHQKYQTVEWAGYDFVGGSIERSSDTMHARQLYSDLQQAEYLGDEPYRGRPHQKLKVTLKSGIAFTHYIDKQSGLIAKTFRLHPHYQLVYIFSNHQVTGGITWASDMNFFMDGELYLTSVLRGLELNPDIKEAFTAPANYASWGETFDSSTMTAREVADGIYQAGQQWDKTVFIEQKDHYIAIGDASGLQQNFEAIKEVAKNHKPLGHFILSHHHRGNLRGLANVFELGAKLVLSNEHKATVEESLQRELDPQEILLVSDDKPVHLGNMTLFDIATAHSKHYLLAHIKDQRLLVAEDHYGTELKTAKPRIYKDMVLFGEVLKSLKIDVETLIDTRSWRQIKMTQFNRWVAEFKTPQCPVGYEVCAAG